MKFEFYRQDKTPEEILFLMKFECPIIPSPGVMGALQMKAEVRYFEGKEMTQFAAKQSRLMYLYSVSAQIYNKYKM